MSGDTRNRDFRRMYLWDVSSASVRRERKSMRFLDHHGLREILKPSHSRLECFFALFYEWITMVEGFGTAS
jgi:hypothetical protein